MTEKIPYESSLSSLLTAVVRKAQEDGRISSEESELINKIQINVRNFEGKMMEYKKEASSIQEIFLKFKDDIVKEATETAKSDGIITEDEEAIINKLISELESIEK